MGSDRGSSKRRYGLVDRMTADDFCYWLSQMDISDRDAAYLLRISRNSVAKYKVSGAPRLVALACMALHLEIEPFSKRNFLPGNPAAL